jgi:hypothetical protein
VLYDFYLRVTQDRVYQRSHDFSTGCIATRVCHSTTLVPTFASKCEVTSFVAIENRPALD